jgi:hypothetical protein
MTPLDYGRSFAIGNGPENEVRFWVESRTRIIDERSGTHEDYIQCASCKSENTFAERDLFHTDNYDFLPIFGPEWGVVFRRKAYLNDAYRETRPASEWWNGQQYHLIEGPARELPSQAEILEATYRHAPLVSQTEVADAGTGLRAIIECPVKTMNTCREAGIYQVDTGPVAFPDLSTRPERSADALRLAFLAFNVSTFVDVVVEVPTRIDEAGPTTEVFHYSELISLPATNRLYAIDV